LSSAPPFLRREIALAVVVSVLAQLTFVCALLLPPPAPLEADFTDDNARPIAVAITPIPLLKLGQQKPSLLPSRWQRSAARAPKPAAADPTEVPPPSTLADPNADPIRPTDGGSGSRSADASSSDALDAAAPSATPDATATPLGALDGSAALPGTDQLGAANGSANGTETDPLKARAADIYRAQLASWFAARFQVRGKVPFEELQNLHATAVVTTSADRRVTGFTLAVASGNAAFDEAVRSSLAQVQGGGGELPAPPPAYPEMLTRQVPVSFRCTVRSQCE